MAAAASRRHLTRWPLELGLVAAVFLAYRAGRLFTMESTDLAVRNAERVMSFEHAFGWNVEAAVQQWALDAGVIGVLNRYYVGAHFPVTVAVLVWLFVRHPERYRAVRNWFVVVTAAALALHVLVPLAPPRMMPGFVDTLREFGPSIYPADPARSSANQLAAMPSLHFGWSLMVALSVPATRTIGRVLWLLHPTITLLAIVATANHYLLDAAVAALLALAAAPVLRLTRPRNPSTNTPDVRWGASDATEPDTRASGAPSAVAPHGGGGRTPSPHVLRR